MPKYVGEALDVRGKAVGYTSKDRKKDLETYLATGRHPELERARESQQQFRQSRPPLPDPSTSRPYAYFKLKAGKKDMGKVVIECFEDVAPAAVSIFRNRCSDNSFQGPIHQIIKDLGFYGGKSASNNMPHTEVKRYSELCHVEEGAVSLSHDGTEFCIARTQSKELDANYQVVGRVTPDTLIVLHRVCQIPVDVDSKPVQKVYISECGFTNAQGTADEQGATQTRDYNETVAETLESTKEAIEAALNAKKRKAEPTTAKKRGGMMDDLLLGSDDSDSD